MSDFFDNTQDNTQNELETAAEPVLSDAANGFEEESTVFSAPKEHKHKAPKKGNKKRLTSIIAAALAVAVLIGGTVTVIKLIPELQDEEVADSIFEDITVLDNDSSNFKTVTITNSNGTFNFVTQKIETTNDDGEVETTEYWTAEGIDATKLSTTTMESIISSAASITAIREINSKSASDCGFDEPSVKVTVDDKDGNSYAFFIGDESSDMLGYYFMLEGSDKIYVVAAGEFSDFLFSLNDLGDKTSIPATLFEADTSENKTEDGSYAYFDSLTLSGKNFPETVTIINNNEDTASAEIVPYLITTPTKRYANSSNLSSLVSLFSNTTTVEGNYAFDITDETLKQYRLDNPDVIVTMTIEGESKSFEISAIDNTYCAVIYDGATMIRKVSTDSFAFMSLKAEDFYNKNPFLYAISDLSSLSLKTDEDDIKFDISITEDEDSNKVYNISANGTKITASDFQDFYADFVMIECSDFTIEDVSGEPNASIIFDLNDGSDVTINFYKVNATQYQYSIDGVNMGRITSSAYTKMIRNIKAQLPKE